jgi:hypothetical protein
MMTQDRDYEDILRRALASAAESFEPTGDGLRRIRHRLDSRRSPRSALSGFAEWLELHGTRFLVRLEPVTEAGRTALRRTRPLSAPLLALAGFLASLFSPRGRRRAGGHRGPASPLGRLGGAGAWLKPVLAVSTAVAIVVVGVVILNHESGTLIGVVNSNVGPATSGAGHGNGGTTANSKRWKLPIGVKATQVVTGPSRNPKVKSVLPVVACTPTPSPMASATAPSGTGTATPTPSASGTATDTPGSPQPTDTSLPTPTPTASPATGGGTATETPAAMVLPDNARAPAVVECGASPKP